VLRTDVDRLDLELRAAQDKLGRLRSYRQTLHVLGTTLPLLSQVLHGPGPSNLPELR
jgi:hypothetical protein